MFQTAIAYDTYDEYNGHTCTVAGLKTVNMLFSNCKCIHVATAAAGDEKCKITFKKLKKYIVYVHMYIYDYKNCEKK